MRVKWIGIGAAVILTWVASTETGRTWNDIGHRLYVEKAIEALPKPLKSFYDKNKVALAEAVSDPESCSAGRSSKWTASNRFPSPTFPRIASSQCASTAKRP